MKTPNPYNYGIFFVAEEFIKTVLEENNHVLMDLFRGVHIIDILRIGVMSSPGSFRVKATCEAFKKRKKRFDQVSDDAAIPFYNAYIEKTRDTKGNEDKFSLMWERAFGKV